MPSIYLTDDLAEREEAVKLVSTSVASQQYFAVRTLLTHPLNLSIFLLLIFLASRITQCWLHGSTQNQSEAARLASDSSSFLLFRVSPVILVWSAILAFGFVTVYVATYAYKTLASDYDAANWLQPGDDVVVATSAADGVVIGAVIIGWTTCYREAGKNGGRKRRVSKAWIKAWTVRYFHCIHSHLMQAWTDAGTGTSSFTKARHWHNTSLRGH